jgi:hypothetical protein
MDDEIQVLGTADTLRFMRRWIKEASVEPIRFLSLALDAKAPGQGPAMGSDDGHSLRRPANPNA